MSTLFAVSITYAKLIAAWSAASSNTLVNADDEGVRDRQPYGLAGCVKMSLMVCDLIVTLLVQVLEKWG